MPALNEAIMVVLGSLRKGSALSALPGTTRFAFLGAPKSLQLGTECPPRLLALSQPRARSRRFHGAAIPGGSSKTLYGGSRRRADEATSRNQPAEQKRGLPQHLYKQLKHKGAAAPRVPPSTSSAARRHGGRRRPRRGHGRAGAEERGPDGGRPDLCEGLGRAGRASGRCESRKT